MNEETANKAIEVTEKVVDGLATEPCYLLIFSVFVISAWIINRGYAHAKDIGELNLKQIRRLNDE